MVSVPAEISTVTPTEIVAVLRMRPVPDVPAEPSMYATMLEWNERNLVAVQAESPVGERTVVGWSVATPVAADPNAGSLRVNSARRTWVLTAVPGPAGRTQEIGRANVRHPITLIY